MNIKFNVNHIFLLLGIFLIGVVVGNFTPVLASNGVSGIKQIAKMSAGTSTEKIDIKTFWKVWDILDSEFVATQHRDPGSDDANRTGTSTVTGDLSTISTEERRLYGAIKGMVDSEGDPYTTFFTPSEASSFETEIKGSFEGVGMEVGKKEGVITVVTPLPGSPAEKAGIKAGDKVLKIGDSITTDMTIDNAVKLIRGKKGTSVSLTMYRDGQDKPFEVKVVRDTIDLPTLTKKYDKATGIFTIKIYSFSETVVNLFKEAIYEFQSSGSTRLIIDLRGNPGGYLDAAVQIASYFIPEGKVIVSQDYGKKQPIEYLRSLGYGELGSQTKVIVLVDGGSASASEILAGALQDYKIATVVGQTTYGKGSVQEYLKITPTTGLKVTIARWLTPLGKSISVSGLTPDVEVKISEEDFKKQVDTQYQKAVEILRK